MSPSPGPSPTPHIEGSDRTGAASGRTVTKVAIIAVLAVIITAGVANTLSHLLQDGEHPRSTTLSPTLLCLAGVLWSAGIAAQGPRWAVLLPTTGRPPGVVRSALAVLGTNGLTVTIPGPSGEALLASFCERDLGIPWATGAAAKFLSRLLGLALLGAFLLAGVAFIPGVESWAPAGIAALTVGTVLLGIYMFSSHGIRAVAVALIGLLPTSTRARVQAPLLAIINHALAPGGQSASHWVRATCWSVVSTGLMGAGGYASALAVGVAPEWSVYLWMHVVSSLAGLVGMLIPAGLGPLDALWVALFVVVRAPGVDAATAAQQGVLAAVAWRQMQAISLLISLPPLGWVVRRTSG